MNNQDWQDQLKLIRKELSQNETNLPTVGDVKVIKSGPNNEPQIFITKKGK